MWNVSRFTYLDETLNGSWIIKVDSGSVAVNLLWINQSFYNVFTKVDKWFDHLSNERSAALMVYRTRGWFTAWRGQAWSVRAKSRPRYSEASRRCTISVRSGYTMRGEKILRLARKDCMHRAEFELVRDALLTSIFDVVLKWCVDGKYRFGPRKVYRTYCGLYLFAHNTACLTVTRQLSY